MSKHIEKRLAAMTMRVSTHFFKKFNTTWFQMIKLVQFMSFRSFALRVFKMFCLQGRTVFIIHAFC